MMSDAPAHHLFCLLGPIVKKDQLPEILVVIQICFEGEISSDTVSNAMSRGRKAAGDLIPWNVSEQYNDKEFPKLAGARIVRIATHPNYQRMGYGKRALKLLKHYYEGKFTNLNEIRFNDDDDDNGIEEIGDEEVGLLKEEIKPRKKVPTLLKRLSERRPEKLDYIGTSFGLTPELLKFWKNQKFVPVYLSQKTNDLTGEHSCIMITELKHPNDDIIEKNDWLSNYFNDFRRRIMKLLGKSFSSFSTGFAMSILDNKSVQIESKEINKSILDTHFISHDIQRLEAYCRNQVEYRLILDLTTDLAVLCFENRLNNVKIDTLQRALLLGVGLQNRVVDSLAEEFNMPGNQILAKLYDCIKKLTKSIMNVLECDIEQTMISERDLDTGKSLNPLAKSMNDELDEAAKVLELKQKKELVRLKKENLAQFAIKGNEIEWNKALSSNKSTIISIKSGEKRIGEGLSELDALEEPSNKKKKKKDFQHKKRKFGGKN